ncbi:MAG: type VI secretion system baseplate subunit TssE [Candidatus Zixiibacteriota bacterium]
MISERTLFERLADPDPPGGRRLGIDPGRLKRSVLSHLRKMLNSRHGHAPAQPDYGIPDLNEFMFAYPDSIGPMRLAIERSIEKYEPRLRNAKAAWVADPDNPLNIRFEIAARLITEDENIPVAFSTSVGTASSLDIEES